MNQFSSDPVEISVDQVPQYLRSGHFFKTLKENNDGHFSVPANVLKASPTINSVDDLRHLLRSLQYWIAWDPNYKETIIKYILICNFPQLVVELIQEFEIAFPFLQVIRLVLETEPDDHESKFSPLPLVQYVLRKQPCAPAILAHLTDHESVKNKSSAEISTFLLKYNVESVAGEGHLELLKNLYVHKIRTTSLCYHAAKNGHLDCLEYLVRQNSHLRERTSHIAAANGHLHILKFLHQKRKPFDIYCCRQAALNGHLECLKYLRSIGCPWGVHVPSSAAHNGHLDCLKFARESGCAWDGETCYQAAAGGQLACLQYAREQGCPWDQRSTTHAVPHMSCLVYSLDNGCAYVPNIAENDAAGFYLLAHCTQLRNDVSVYAAREGRVDILQACVNARIPLHLYTCLTAAAAGHKDCLEFALSNGAPAVGDLTLRDPNDVDEDDNNAVGEIVGKIGKLGV